MNELLGGVELDESGDHSKPPSNRIEQAITWIADALWAVVGLVLWIPQIVRVVLTSAARLIHAALTRQSIDGIRGPIREVSQFYVEGFLSAGRRRGSSSYRSRELRLGRFLVEALWVAAVWLAVLRLVSPDLFASVWQALTRLAAWSYSGSRAAVLTAADHLPATLRVFADFGTGASIALALVLLAFLLAGYFLGRRRR